MTRQAYGDALAGDLWMEADGPMPACRRCRRGDHAGCVDLMVVGRFGLVSCGCDDPSHLVVPPEPYTGCASR